MKEIRHCTLCHAEWIPDEYADGCCCCRVHRAHGGKFISPTVPKKIRT